MWLFIQPHDTLFFRDGRPFNAGADVWTNTIFPPYPHTLYGMLRTLLAHGLLECPDYDDLLTGIKDGLEKDLLGTKEKTGSLSIYGPFLSRKKGEKAHVLLSSPADLFALPESAGGKPDACYLMSPVKNKDVSTYSDMSLPFLPLSFGFLEEGIKPEVLEPVSLNVSNASLLTYLKGKTGDNLGAMGVRIRMEPFITEEICPIIARDDALCAREGHLALPLHTRMQNSLNYEEKGLLLKIEGTIPDPVRLKLEAYIRAGPVIKLGGEGRVAKVEIVSHDFTRFHDDLFSKIAETGRFRTVLTSPAYFPENAFFPDFLDADLSGDWRMNGETRRVRLVSAAMNRPQAVGSWDISAIRPRETVKMVSAGSVFFFELQGFDRQKDEKWMLDLARQSFPGAIPGGEEDYVKKGFNTFIIGAWDYVS